MKVAIYARVSTKNQDEEQQIPAICKGFNLDVNNISIFREEVSAWRIDKEEKRFELQALIKAIKNGEIRRLYIWHIDRLYRNRSKMREFFNLCLYHKVEVYSLHQKWLNDFQRMKQQMPENMQFLIENMYNLMLDVYSQTAEDESRTKSERVKLKVVKQEGQVTKSISGKKWGRKSLPQRVINDVLQLNIQGKSMREIAKTVQYYDKHKHLKNLSVGAVHKIISENKVQNDTQNT